MVIVEKKKDYQINYCILINESEMQDIGNYRGNLLELNCQ